MSQLLLGVGDGAVAAGQLTDQNGVALTDQNAVALTDQTGP